LDFAVSVVACCCSAASERSSVLEAVFSAVTPEVVVVVGLQSLGPAFAPSVAAAGLLLVNFAPSAVGLVAGLLCFPLHFL